MHNGAVGCFVGPRSDAAWQSGVNAHRIGKLMKACVFRAEQVVPGALSQSLAADLAVPSVAVGCGS